MSLAFIDARPSHRASPSWPDRVEHVALTSEPLRIRAFTTNTSSAWAPGSLSLILGLFGNLRQTNNSLDWQDDDIVRCTVPELAIQASPIGSSVNKEAVRENLFEVRRLTGFTWEEISDLLGVDRRTLHNWSQGGFVRGANQERLADLLDVLRHVDRGSVEANRLALSQPNQWGATGLSLLSQGRFQEAQVAIGKGGVRRVPTFAANPIAALRTGPLGIGYFSAAAGLIDNTDSREPPPQPTRSRRVKLKRG